MVLRGIGIVRCGAKIGLRNLAYNLVVPFTSVIAITYLRRMELEEGGCRTKTFRRGDYGRHAALYYVLSVKKGGGVHQCAGSRLRTRLRAKSYRPLAIAFTIVGSFTGTCGLPHASRGSRLAAPFIPKTPIDSSLRYLHTALEGTGRQLFCHSRKSKTSKPTCNQVAPA